MSVHKVPAKTLTQRLNKLTQGFRALEVRNYRLYWFGQLVSLTGTWMQSTAQALLVLRLTDSPSAVGLVVTLQFLPFMLLSLIGGTLADRINRYRLILFTQSISLVLAALFGFLVGTGNILLWHIYVLAFLQGFVNAVDQPVRQAFAVSLVSSDYRANAVALNSVLFNTTRILGPALAGVLIGWLGIAAIFYLNALSFVGVLYGLLRMDRTELNTSPPKDTTPMVARVREGLAYVFHTPDILLVMLLVAAIGTFGYNFSITLPLIGGFLLNLQQNAVAYGALGALLGIGSLAAALVTAYSKTVTTRRLFLAAILFSVFFAAVALSHTYLLSALLLFILGFAGVTFTTTANTLIQTQVPDALRGRVISVYLFLFMGSTPVGGLVTSSAAQLLGVSGALLLCAFLCAVGVIGTFLYHLRHKQTTEVRSA